MNKLLPLLLFCTTSGTALPEELVRFPDTPATWTVACKQKDTPDQGSPPKVDPEQEMTSTLKSVEVAQTESAHRSILRWSNGKSRELWSLPKLDMFLTEDPSGNAFTTRNAVSFGDPFGRSNFEWLRPEVRTNEKPVKYDGVECYHYAGFLVVPGLAENSVARTIPCEAWINAQTLLPVALLKGDTFGRYSFGPPPDNLVMPKKFKETLDYYKMTTGE